MVKTKSQNATQELLESLGWSAELIQSYLKVSTELKKMEPPIQTQPATLVFNFGVTSQSEIDLSGSAPNGSNHIAVVLT